jgi:hypothetical protein
MRLIRLLFFFRFSFVFSTDLSTYFQGVQLLSDVNYSQGFDVIPACSSDPTECTKAERSHLLNPFFHGSNPSISSWELAQWSSHSNLSTIGTPVYDNRSQGMQWSTNDKHVTLFQDGRLQLAVNGFHEYGGIYKSPNAPWVHLLIQQDIGRKRGSIALNEVTELQWDLDVQLLYMDQHVQSGYNSDLHAAIFPLYITIQNLIHDDPEYGKYIWLGLNLYDDRVLMSCLYVNGDAATDSLIYSPAMSDFAMKSIHSGETIHVNGDMMPYVRLGLQAAVERGFLRSNDLNRYFVGGMNIGWEVTGLNTATIEIGKLSLKQYTAQHPRPYEFNRNGDTEGWTRLSDLEQVTSGPLNGQWILLPSGFDPQLLSPKLKIDTSVVKKIIIHMANDHLSDDQFQLFWSTHSDDLFSEQNSSWIQVANDGGWRDYIIDLSNNLNWKGIVHRLRIDPVRFGNSSGFGFDYIRFAS